MYEIEEYVTENDTSPFADWLEGLRDTRARMRLLARLDGASLGNLGDWKAVSGVERIAELRDHNGPRIRGLRWSEHHSSPDRIDQAPPEQDRPTGEGLSEGLPTENRTMRASRPFRATQLALLKDPDNAALYLEEALAAGDTAGFKLALRNVAEARLGA